MSCSLPFFPYNAHPSRQPVLRFPAGAAGLSGAARTAASEAEAFALRTDQRAAERREFDQLMADKLAAAARERDQAEQRKKVSAPRKNWRRKLFQSFDRVGLKDYSSKFGGFAGILSCQGPALWAKRRIGLCFDPQKGRSIKHGRNHQG